MLPFDFILDSLRRTCKHAQVDFQDPDKIIVETIGIRAVVGVIKTKRGQRYSFIKVK